MELLGRYSREVNLAISVQKLLDRLAEDPGRTERRVPVAVRVHKLGQRLDAVMVAAIVAEYQAGAASRQVARRFGIGKASVIKLVREAGIRVRPPC